METVKNTMLLTLATTLGWLTTKYIVLSPNEQVAWWQMTWVVLCFSMVYFIIAANLLNLLGWLTDGRGIAYEPIIPTQEELEEREAMLAEKRHKILNEFFRDHALSDEEIAEIRHNEQFSDLLGRVLQGNTSPAKPTVWRTIYHPFKVRMKQRSEFGAPYEIEWQTECYGLSRELFHKITT